MTTGSFRASSSLVAVAALLAGCVDELALEHATTSLEVKVSGPNGLGSETAPLADDQRELTITVTARDQSGDIDTTLASPVELYVHFLGTLTPDPSRQPPLTTIPMSQGQGTLTLELAATFGANRIWVEDVSRAGATYATGVSEPVWFRDPLFEDISRPVNPNGLDALQRSPLEGKQVTVSTSSFGAGGHLVVTGVYAQGYTISDTRIADRTAPDYGHNFIFTFGRPRASNGDAIEVGHVVKAVSGGVSEFLGYTEFNFPQTDLAAGRPDQDFVPVPVKLEPGWLSAVVGPTGMINLEKLESGLVKVEGATVCALDVDYDRFSQWKLGVAEGANPCVRVYNVITKGQVSDFDPGAVVGQKLTRVVGTLKAINTGSTNVWILQPRIASDIVP